jgi:hypothetical protein
MILQLRQRHRRVFAILGVLLPLAFAFGITARRTVPHVATLPVELAAKHSFVGTHEELDRVFEQSPVRVRLWREQGTGRLAVGFTSANDFLIPDLMAYWSAAQVTTNDNLPPDARLLGAARAGPLVLPAEASASDGILILFSLANQEIVDVSKPTRFSNAMK